MAAVLIYNSKTLTFTDSAYRRQIDYPRSAIRNISASGIAETLNVRAACKVSVGFRNFEYADATDETLRRNLLQFIAWAEAGNSWTFAIDSAEQVNTTLTATEAAGSTVIGLTSSTGVDASGFYVIRSLTHLELVKVATVDSGVQVTLTETLNHAYVTGDRFRSELFWAGLLTSAQVVDQGNGLHWSFELEFTEDVNEL